MQIYLSNSGQEPIYAQITRQIKQQILSGALRPGDALPSIRLLAKELRISVITTKRAYEDLERDGFILTQQGRGSFVAEQNPALLREEHLKKVEDCLQGAVDAARLGGIGRGAAQQVNRAVIRPVDAAEDFQKRRLACAVLADQPDDAARGHGHINRSKGKVFVLLRDAA